ncbi:MAG: choline-sulfatase, partial [Planctomycetota bacterium]
MMRAGQLVVLLGLLWATSAGAMVADEGKSTPSARPNILFILTDDQAVDTLAAWGTWGNDSQVVRTPNLDRLVARGTSFTRAYNMGSYSPAVCVCSRGMLITGRKLWATEKLQRTKFAQQLATGEL